MGIRAYSLVSVTAKPQVSRIEMADIAAIDGMLIRVAAVQHKS